MGRLLRLATAVAMFGLTPGCTAPTSHILVGNPYDPAQMCLEPSTGFDMVDGPEPAGQCPPTCVIDAKTGTTYVTVTCSPYPPLDTSELADASTGPGDPCKPALAAWAAQVVCGGALDGGVHAEAGGDATRDAPTGAGGG